jgi:SAM-dependent methyltransferase
VYLLLTGASALLRLFVISLITLDFDVLRRPSVLRSRAFAHAFSGLSPAFSAFEDTTEIPALLAAAHGIVLELGPGVGGQCHRFDQNKVTHVFGVEANGDMIAELRAKAEAAGFEVDQFDLTDGTTMAPAAAVVETLAATTAAESTSEEKRGLRNRNNIQDKSSESKPTTENKIQSEAVAGESKSANGKRKSKYTILHCGAQDLAALREAGIVEGKEALLDCIVSVQVLCSVPEPEEVVRGLYRLLKPGGDLMVYEHLGCRGGVGRIVQNLYNPFWQFALLGCSLNRASDDWLLAAGEWDKVDWKRDSDHGTLFPRVKGRLVKAL